MRKTLLLAVITALGVAGTAFAAVTVTNHYTYHTKVTPVKSGTRAHPRAVALHVDSAVTATPAGFRPNIVKTVDLTAQGLQAHPNFFPPCGTARLTDPSEGPRTCPKGSLAGTGFFNVWISKPGDQTPSGKVLTCRVEMSIYNGGGNTLSIYVFSNGKPGECPLSRPVAFPANLRQTGGGLVLTFTIPFALRHPAMGTPPYQVTFDAAAIKASADLPAKQTTVKHKKGKKTIKTKVGLFESISCPHNHQRFTSIKFTLENGHSNTLTRLVSCS
jgi:hypothetical protein